MTDETPKKRGRGRPEHVPDEKTRQTVIVLAGAGVGAEIIAQVIGLSVNTLSKYYDGEVKNGAAMANAMVGANLFKQATKDDIRAVTAAVMWLKMRAGWNEHGPLPPVLREQKEKAEKLGKKELADIEAANPDVNTPMGQLMAQRRATLQ